jgi:hypothetical protein
LLLLLQFQIAQLQIPMNLVFVWECHRLQGKKKLSCGTKTILNAPVDWRVKGGEDVIDYKNRNDAERMKVLDELAAEAQELNMRY